MKHHCSVAIIAILAFIMAFSGSSALAQTSEEASPEALSQQAASFRQILALLQDDIDAARAELAELDAARDARKAGLGKRTLRRLRVKPPPKP